LEIQVVFKPNEYRYYSDSIKIYSEVSWTFKGGYL